MVNVSSTALSCKRRASASRCLRTFNCEEDAPYSRCHGQLLDPPEVASTTKHPADTPSKPTFLFQPLAKLQPGVVLWLR